jgi:nicotinate-nucleotide adenylyltransferase
VTDIEVALGSPYTADTVAWLKRRRPDLSFVWLMGADNLASFHRWRRWRTILATVPIAIADRPGRGQSDLAARAFRHFVRFRTPEAQAGTLARKRPPAWVFLRGPRVDLSSTDLRRRKAKGSS